MQELKGGQFFGQTTKTVMLNGLTLTDTVYTHDKVDWHYHEHAYFTFVLQGCVNEINKKETITCTPGTLLFHNWHEPHANIKAPVHTRGFHVEIDHQWLLNFFSNDSFSGNLSIEDPSVKLLFYKIFCETKMNDKEAALGIESLLLETFTYMQSASVNKSRIKPTWVNIVKEILHDNVADSWSLTNIAAAANIHPVHLSRDFSKYFGCNIATYVRKLKVQRALTLLPAKQHTLAGISYECGFADQSHFIKCFKMCTGLSPFAYRKLLR